MGSEGLKEEEIELELGLSLGGSFKDSTRKPSFVEQGSNNVVVGVRIDEQPKTKREIQALRRQQAKKKREEKKQIKRGLLKAEASDHHAKSGGEFVMELAERECKKIKVNDSGSYQNDMNNVNLNLGIHQIDMNLNTTASCPPLPPQYFYPYPEGNGFVHPFGDANVTPLWVRGGDGVGKDGSSVVKPVVGIGVGPLPVVSDSGLDNGGRPELKGSRDDGNKRTVSNGLSICNSSAGSGSDRKSTSIEGGGISDSRSHSSCSVPDQGNVSKSSNARSLYEHTATSHLEASTLVNEATNHVDETILSSSSRSCITGTKESASETEQDHTSNGRLTKKNSNFSPSKETKSEVGKPPKPQRQNHSTVPLSCMPSVSARGDGPNGKTINGFLYRYTKTEVSIICVCHGSSFSPAEFIQHAGGTDVSHPLRHITVMPSVLTMHQAK